MALVVATVPVLGPQVRTHREREDVLALNTHVGSDRTPVRRPENSRMSPPRLDIRVANAGDRRVGPSAGMDTRCALDYSVNAFSFGSCPKPIDGCECLFVYFIFACSPCRRRCMDWMSRLCASLALENKQWSKWWTVSRKEIIVLLPRRFVQQDSKAEHTFQAPPQLGTSDALRRASRL